MVNLIYVEGSLLKMCLFLNSNNNCIDKLKHDTLFHAEIISGW